MGEGWVEEDAGYTGRVRMEELIRRIILEIGEDPEREGLKDTPRRVEETLRSLTDGYSMDPEEILREGILEGEGEGLVLAKEIEFFSLCEHHMLPFFGRCHVAYIPNGKLVGISKIARLVDVFAHRLQVQERMTKQIADEIEKALDPAGVAVIVEAQHLCMMMRGVKKHSSRISTSDLRGRFRDDPQLLQELRMLLGMEG